MPFGEDQLSAELVRSDPHGYLPLDARDRLLHNITALSAKGSRFAVDSPELAASQPRPFPPTDRAAQPAVP
jgi:O-methyltransferase involved in polyketide biosynthesis